MSMTKIDEILSQRVSDKQLLSAFQLYLNHIEDSASKARWFDECQKIWQDSTFNIKKLSIKDYRLIDQLDLFLDNSLTLIIGENGTGKTTILDALAKTLMVLTSAIKSKTSSGTPLNERDIRLGKRQCDYFKIFSELELGQNNKISCVLAKARSGYPIAIKNSFQDLKLLGNAIQYLSVNKQNHLPVMVYYSIKRSEKMRPHDIVKTSEYKNRISDLFNPDNLNGSLTLDSFQEWYLQLNRSTEEQNKHFLQLFNDLLVSHVPYLEDIRVNTINGYETLEVKISEVFRNISLLSDGQRLFLALIADLAKRLIISNEGSSNPFKGCGIVLIDEIELHLHPQWQREILPSLMEIFPNLQFIVTTHSPQVITSVEAKHIRVLYYDSEGKITLQLLDYETDGATSSEVLNRLMGVSPRREKSKRVQKLEKFLDYAFDLNTTNEFINKLYEDLKTNIKNNEDMLNEAAKAKLSLEIRKKLNN